MLKAEVNESQIIDKIEKLLRLSTSSNVNEAMIAMKKARSLMLKYHIDEIRLNSDIEIKEKVLIEEQSIKFAWESFIYAIICKNMRCTIYLNGTKQVIIIGYKSDINAVKIMSNFVVDACIQGLRTERQNISKEKYSTQGLANIYRIGFLNGLQQAFEEQNQNKEYALMIIIPPKVKQEDELYKMKNDIHTRAMYAKINTNDAKAYRNSYKRGYDKGYESGGKKQISS